MNLTSPSEIKAPRATEYPIRLIGRNAIDFGTELESSRNETGGQASLDLSSTTERIMRIICDGE